MKLKVLSFFRALTFFPEVKEEDELLLRYESMRGACQNARTELSTAIGMPIGTLDGVLSRARKRRSLEPVA